MTAFDADARLRDLLGIALPILQAPMAGSNDSALAIAVSEAGGLGAAPCAMLSLDQIRAEVVAIRAAIPAPFNLNFFCHRPPAPDSARLAAWKTRLTPLYAEYDLDPEAPVAAAQRNPFDEAACALIEELRPPVVSFHFGLPEQALLARVRASGAKILSSATSVAEAQWLEARGVDAIIAQGVEAGGHRGMFLSEDIVTQSGLFSLLPQIAAAVRVPVIAAGGIVDGAGIAAAFALGAAGVQIGTAYLFCPEAKPLPAHRAALEAAGPDATALTNVMTGRPARGIVNRAMRTLGPISAEAPAFPDAATPLAPLRRAAEAKGSGDFSPLWAGEAVARARRGLGAGALTRALAAEARAALTRLG